MPTETHSKNPYVPGMVVHRRIAGNGYGEGVLWRVKKVHERHVWITPCLTITGPSVLRDAKVLYYELDVPDLLVLCRVRCRVRLELDNIINELVRHRAATDGAGDGRPGDVDG